jgi:hypothetical protein
MWVHRSRPLGPRPVNVEHVPQRRRQRRLRLFHDVDPGQQRRWPDRPPQRCALDDRRGFESDTRTEIGTGVDGTALIIMDDVMDAAARERLQDGIDGVGEDLVIPSAKKRSHTMLWGRSVTLSTLASAAIAALIRGTEAGARGAPEPVASHLDVGVE